MWINSWILENRYSYLRFLVTRSTDIYFSQIENKITYPSYNDSPISAHHKGKQLMQGLWQHCLLDFDSAREIVTAFTVVVSKLAVTTIAGTDNQVSDWNGGVPVVKPDKETRML
ncbi:hypothetical protein DAPPUDRAFT_253716 [Daphnia pulex]|uniref:Uncharacterized protein n=1 Tax=Daphnia pulex TaxID=6669 RepID=E9H5P7_DAPPU|nr:hypothetical protein DAPPUDRAFT_253716 [Daphnia pulex]|eukprot:EFX72910.1 hypothetical protein DAPPUDRAFT_253716 [Daphnia pulex]